MRSPQGMLSYPRVRKSMHSYCISHTRDTLWPQGGYIPALQSEFSSSCVLELSGNCAASEYKKYQLEVTLSPQF